MINTQIYSNLNFFIFQLSQSCDTMPYIPTLDRLERYETIVLYGPISNILVIFICKCMSHKQVISFLKPRAVSSMLLITYQAVLSSQSYLNL